MTLKALMDSLEGVEPHFHSLYTERNGKFELTGIEGVKTEADIARLQTALNKERNDHKAIKERFAPLGERKVEEIVTMLDKYPELETAAAGKIDETKLEGIVESRLRTKVAPLEREKQTLTEQLSGLQRQVLEFQTREVQRTIGDAVRTAASKVKVVDTAVEDVGFLAERIFTIDEGGKVVAKDNVGCTPGISPEIWLNEMQTKKPHWWGPSMGGGAGGGRSHGGASNPWAAATWNMTEQGRIYTENPSRADQLARSAGTTIGGPRPQGK